MVPNQIEELKSDLSDMEKMIEGYLTLRAARATREVSKCRRNWLQRSALGSEMALKSIHVEEETSDLKTHRIWQMPEQPDRERQPIR